LPLSRFRKYWQEDLASRQSEVVGTLSFVTDALKHKAAFEVASSELDSELTKELRGIYHNDDTLSQEQKICLGFINGQEKTELSQWITSLNDQSVNNYNNIKRKPNLKQTIEDYLTAKKRLLQTLTLIGEIIYNEIYKLEKQEKEAVTS